MQSKILQCTCTCLIPPPSCCVAGLAMYSCAISLEAEKAKTGKAKKCGTFCRLIARTLKEKGKQSNGCWPNNKITLRLFKKQRTLKEKGKQWLLAASLL